MAAPDLRPLPFLVGRYRCEEYLGGGMADVYRARDTELPRDVAIKILKPESEEDDQARQSFLDEVQIACQCSHENIVITHDKGEFRGAPFIVMEFLRGQDLGTIIESDTRRDPVQAVRYALQTARALAYVHSKNIVHRDLKPQNLHVDECGHVKLVDFGIAKSVDWNKTLAGWTKGTVSYMAPEQIRAEPAAFRTDVWAFGVVLYEMLTGVRPFQGANYSEVFAAILNANPNFELLNKPGIPESLRNVVRRCLEKKAEKRYPGFAPICLELEGILEDLQHARPAASATTMMRLRQQWRGWTTSRHFPRTAAILGVCIVVLLLAALFVAKGRSPRELHLLSGDMVLVPAGTALLGEHPHPVEVSQFYIDRTEVSNRAYGEFVKATSHSRPVDFREDLPEYPVVNVTFDDAEAFAKWAGKRLPTYVEWEKAARGTDGRVFPWGNQPDGSLANVQGTRNPGSVMPVDSFPKGASPYGALNMIGNVWEWVDARRTPEAMFVKSMQARLKPDPPLTMTEAYYATRGGYYDFALSPTLIWEFAAFPARLSSKVIGFRCARTNAGRQQ
jgi:formylglycine-generating enzyme required for sulfatase activity